ncbi:hypothetical protein [Holospora undulata]|uniref:hypothetical protein n=1 Tax=Holospora undulata TaxID=1169117 RepID=UPI0012691EE7|nr:hypothetical protein [Holospora undulata]
MFGKNDSLSSFSFENENSLLLPLDCSDVQSDHRALQSSEEILLPLSEPSISDDSKKESEICFSENFFSPFLSEKLEEQKARFECRDTLRANTQVFFSEIVFPTFLFEESEKIEKQNNKFEQEDDELCRSCEGPILVSLPKGEKTLEKQNVRFERLKIEQIKNEEECNLSVLFKEEFVDDLDFFSFSEEVVSKRLEQIKNEEECNLSVLFKEEFVDDLDFFSFSEEVVSKRLEQIKNEEGFYGKISLN